MTEQEYVFVVDDDPIVLDSLAALLSQHNYDVACFSDAPQFLEKAPLDNIGCLISDVQMPSMSGIDLLRQLHSVNSSLSMIGISSVADVPTAVTLMESGAVTILEKPLDQNRLLSSVKRALNASRELWKKLHAIRSVQIRLDTLSEEERLVLDLILRGEPNKNISSKLSMSMRTVDRRRQAIFSKMHVDSVPELATLLSRIDSEWLRHV